MSVIEALRPILLYLKLSGIAPLNISNRKIIVKNKFWMFYSWCLVFLNVAILIFLCTRLFGGDNIYVILSGNLTLLIELTMDVLVSLFFGITMLRNSEELCDILNNIIKIQFIMNLTTKARIKFLRCINFILFNSMIILILVIGIMDWIMNPYQANSSAFHASFYFFCEIILCMYICGYYGILLLIGFLYEDMNYNFIMEVIFSDVYKR